MANVIRLNGVKRIEVNDEGEYILLPVGDDQFLRNFYALVDEAQKKAAEIQTLVCLVTSVLKTPCTLIRIPDISEMIIPHMEKPPFVLVSFPVSITFIQQ